MTLADRQTARPSLLRRLRNIPLVIVAVLALAAAIVGWTVQWTLNSQNNAPAKTAASGPSTVCRPSGPALASEPWISRDAAATAAWDASAAELAGPVVRGQNGWAFYNDQIEQNFSQSVGRTYLTTGEVNAWIAYFESLRRGLASLGIPLLIEITPSAASVYPQELPTWIQPWRGSTPLDQVLAAAPADLPIVDFRAGLIEASASNAVYTPVNSHWTDWGGYIGWEISSACMSSLYPSLAEAEVPAVAGVAEKGVFNEYASYGVPDSTPEWTAPIFSVPLAPVSVQDKTGTTTQLAGGSPVDLSMLPATTTTADSTSDESALILRDSMGNALSTYWTQQYRTTWEIQHRYDDWSSPPNYRLLVEQYRPSVVIVQLAERHLVNAPLAQTTGF
jgi:alginate O-acetyltransferase complex protein AlgJ